MGENQAEPSVILASESPRRRELLTQAGVCFEVIPSSIDEDAFTMAAPEGYVRSLAEAKATAVARLYPRSWVIGADTIVHLDGAVLGKPDAPCEARTMLRQLSGRTHQVFTGYCVCCRSAGRSHSAVVATDVTFKSLTDDEIRWYTKTPEPYDKAGGYGIQGAGAFLVERINGSYTNVVGLPVCEVMDCLTREGIGREGLGAPGPW